MRKQIHKDGFSLWLSANDTHEWATRPGSSWPCSQLSNKRLFVRFDRNGLTAYALNGFHRHDIPADELTAIVVDHILPALPADHPCRTVLN